MSQEQASHYDRTRLIEGELTREIVSAFYKVYNAFGFGLIETVYANSLAIELQARTIRVEREVPVEVLYLGQAAGRFRLDLVVDRKVIVECKATEQLSRVARPQVFNYLRCSSYPIALLLHFGPSPRHFRYLRPDLLKQRGPPTADTMKTKLP